MLAGTRYTVKEMTAAGQIIFGGKKKTHQKTKPRAVLFAVNGFFLIPVGFTAPTDHGGPHTGPQ